MGRLLKLDPKMSLHDALTALMRKTSGERSPAAACYLLSRAIERGDLRLFCDDAEVKPRFFRWGLFVVAKQDRRETGLRR